jgi:transcriptional regulator with XRE-family HTH domain
MTTPEHVKFHRKLLKMTQRDLAAAMGKPRSCASNIFDYEAGNASPRLPMRQLLDETFIREMTAWHQDLGKAIKSYKPLATNQ